MPDARITSIARELGRPVSVESAMDALIPHFEQVFGVATTSGRPGDVVTSAVDTKIPE